MLGWVPPTWGRALVSDPSLLLSLQQIHWWLSGKQWFLEPVSPQWSLFLRNGTDPGEGDWHHFLSDKGPWMWNQVTDEIFLARDGSSQWQRGICSDQQGRLVHYWYSGNRWFLEPQLSRVGRVPPSGGRALASDPSEQPRMAEAETPKQ